MRHVRARTHPPTVLIVDDERSLRFVLHKVVEKYFGAVVLEARSTDEALATLRAQNVDLVITDIVHPGDGVALIRNMRKTTRLRPVPVLVQSGSIPRLGAKARRAGAAALLHKPYTLTELIRTIGRFIPPAGLSEPDVALIELGTEMPTHDYKGPLALETTKQRAALAKDVIAMANSGGGTIIVGVDETAPGRFEPTGCSEEVQQGLETTRLYNAVKRYLDPPMALVSRRVRFNGHDFIFIEVPSAETELVMAAEDHQEVGLYTGRIYGRTAGAESAALKDATEIRQVIERIVDARLRERRGR
ncbi:MAG: response regulator [Gemmatimonadales bacterium]